MGLEENISELLWIPSQTLEARFFLIRVLRKVSSFKLFTQVCSHVHMAAVSVLGGGYDNNEVIGLSGRGM